MFFLNQKKDETLYQDLVRDGVITAVVWESLTLPNEGNLMDVLIGNREKINPKPWIDWLIKNHNCTRIPALDPEVSFVKELPRTLISESLKNDCYALRVGRNHVYIGIGRPDSEEHVEALEAFYKKQTTFRNALSLEEIAFLRNICKEILQSV